MELPDLLRTDDVYGRVVGFARRFGEPHTRLAMHAALPIGLTPELVHLLRVNFAPQARWIAEADLLLSPLCHEVGGGLFEMNAPVRDFLIDELKSDPDFGPGRVVEVAEFLLEYAARALHAVRHPELQDFLVAQQWTALAYARPGEAAEALAAALGASLAAGNQSEVVRIASLTRALSAPLLAEEKVLLYAAGVERLAAGQRRHARRLFEAVGPPDEATRVGAVSLPPAQHAFSVLEPDPYAPPEEEAPSTAPPEEQTSEATGGIGLGGATQGTKVEAEPVRLRVHAPEAVRPEEAFIVGFMAAPEKAEQAGGAGVTTASWRRGIEATVRLAGSHLDVYPSEVAFVWQGEDVQLHFEARAPADASPGSIVLNIEVMVEGAVVARLRHDLAITGEATGAAAGSDVYQSAYASYAREDRERVLAVLGSLGDIAGLDVFTGGSSLHAGERSALEVERRVVWEDRIRKEIEARDLFILFWSANARESSWVEWEWRTALEAKGLDAIRPFTLDPLVPPPDELSALHFTQAEATGPEVYHKEVYLSYAWRRGGESEEIAGRLEEAFRARDIAFVRGPARMGRSIEDFIDQPEPGRAVVVIVGDAYLKSPRCMGEWMRIAEAVSYNRVFPIVLDDAHIDDPKAGLDYRAYWEEQARQARDEAAKNVPDEILQAVSGAPDRYEDFQAAIERLPGLLRDMNTFPAARHRPGFKAVVDAVVRTLDDRVNPE